MAVFDFWNVVKAYVWIENLFTGGDGHLGMSAVKKEDSMSKSNWWTKIWDIIKKLIGDKPDPQPQPEPQPETDHPEVVHTVNGNAKWADMTETCKIVESTFDASGFWSHNVKTPAWPTLSSSNPQDGFICLIWKHPKTGVYQGEYWDCGLSFDYKYVSASQHCLDPESPFAGRLPKSGDRVGNVFVSLDGRQRSNIAWGQWPF